MQSSIIYNAAGYARASKDDADSSTIENQLELIRDFVKSTPDIRIVSERDDNGYSGVDFFRPRFGKMMQDIEAGIVNCVIVKDLSRLGRNYIEVGELLDDVFPRLGVRLIAINDHYDSLNPRTDSDEIIIPFKNLINEQYLRDFSVKIRSNLNVRRKNGDFVAPFAAYGYKRLETDKHRLIIDEHAAGIVRDIFRWKIEGLSQQRIADKLNELGEPSPAEYKKRATKYYAAFQTHSRASWSAVAVGRILRNPAYIGTLVQGTVTTPNYKVKKRIQKPEDEWHVIEEAHEPIIDRHDFETVNGILLQDTRSAPKHETVFPFSGLVYCGDCGNSMVRKKADHYGYYVCATNKAGKGCSTHSIGLKVLERAVMSAIIKQIDFVLDIERCIEFLRGLPAHQRNVVRLNQQIADREKEIKSCENYRRSLYEDYKNGVISKDDYIEFGKDYGDRIAELREAAERLRQEVILLFEGNSATHQWIEQFKRYHNVQEVSRQLVVNLIERIVIYEGKRIDIRFRYQDKLESVSEILNGFTSGERLNAVRDDAKAGCM